MKETIKKSGFSIATVARRLKISRNTLYRRLQEPEVAPSFASEVASILGYEGDIFLFGNSLPKEGKESGSVAFLQKRCVEVPLIYIGALTELVSALIDSKSAHESVLASFLQELRETTRRIRSKQL